MSELIHENSDLLHEVIYEIVDDAQDIKYPIQRVVDFLLTEGYMISKFESTKTSYILYKGNAKTTVTENFISFEKLEQNERERYKQNFYKYLISRSKIFYQSALQNAKAAKINLIQNQRRTCVSNMYYSLHNSFASLVEFYKSDLVIEHNLLELENEKDDEAKLEHFIPKGLEVFLTNIDDILDAEKEEFINNERMNVGRIKSFENPFSWIIPLFTNWFEKKQFLEIINTMKEVLYKINLDNYAVDDSFRRTKFEQQLKENLIQIRETCSTDDCPDNKSASLILAAFLAYAYMLRQSADYDSLFEIKIPHQDIINWTIISSNFLNIVSEFLLENNNNSVERIQKLDAESSTEILRSADTDLQNSIMTMTGIIIDKEFDLIQVIKKLYTQKGYKMINQRGRISHLNNGTDYISICRLIFSTSLESFISISKQGLFRIDIVLSDEQMDRDYVKGVNQYYLEQLIHQDIIEKDLLNVVSKNANIVRGIPTTPQFSSLNYLDLVVGVHERIQRRIFSRTKRFIDELAYSKSSDSLILKSLLSMNKSDFKRRFKSRYFVSSFSRNITTNENITTQNLLLIIFCSYNDLHLENDIHSEMVDIKEKMYKNFTEEFPNTSFHLEFIFLSESENRQLVEEDYSFFEVHLDKNIEKYEKLYISNQDIKSTEDLSMELEVLTDVDESDDIIVEELEDGE